VRGARYALRLLVLRAMAGQHELLVALGRYARFEVSPSELDSYTGARVRSVLQRIDNALGLGMAAARAFASRFAPFVARVVPAYIEYDSEGNLDPDLWLYMCKLCGLVRRYNSMSPQDHLIKHHRREVEEELERVVKLWKLTRQQLQQRLQ